MDSADIIPMMDVTLTILTIRRCLRSSLVNIRIHISASLPVSSSSNRLEHIYLFAFPARVRDISQSGLRNKLHSVRIGGPVRCKVTAKSLTTTVLLEDLVSVVARLSVVCTFCIASSSARILSFCWFSILIIHIHNFFQISRCTRSKNGDTFNHFSSRAPHEWNNNADPLQT